ncbi:TonB-linked outer membrane protein, SusC/RagA family [Tangfeifania diversioriginum]|uniref:TonB-linked outer membrane protein, SusC/RagA family n=1 Tax=Tangfeifania diversioriginum TaxID=1168035 RepID=A0A1M6IFE8_9BACT|nr:SusC/RagA family TonB-linked outer membrane protein [Tangfeifania diversioriginum]SHJ33135.1 TonB-linked outer membrane protein, SusC/RagA family [Tangfeifania diversioriginum]
MKTFTKKLLSLCLLALIMLISGQVFAQETISGTVTEADTGEPLPGVSVVVKGTTTGTVTNVDGEYQLDASIDDILIFSFIGMSTQEVEVNGRASINVELATSVEALEEVVVTGYGGTQKRSKLTNSIASVKEETLTKGTHANPAQALTGAVSGLKVTNVSGNPGATPSIYLRGGTNFDGTGSPLVLIDGQVGAFNDINPNDIESIEVLKDAGATALYGARANNGVILITTKKGGAPEVVLNVKYGLNYLNNPYEFFGAEEYLYWLRKGIQNAAQMYQDSQGDWVGYSNIAQLGQAQPFGTGNRYFDDNGNPLDGNQTSLAVYSPMIYTSDLSFLLDQGWQTMTDPVTGKEIIFSEFIKEKTAFNNPALTQDYNISFSGSNERGKYYAGIGYYDAEGQPAKTWYKRLNFTFNGEYKIRPWFTSNSNFQFTDAKWYDVPTTSEQNYFGRMLSTPPTQREYNPDGELILGNNTGDGNPLVNIDKLKRDNNTNKFIMGQSFKIDFLQNLSLKVNAHWLLDQGYYEAFNQDYRSRPGVINTTRSSSARYNKELSQTYNAVLNYDLTKGNHTASALVGYEFYDKKWIGLSASGSGAPTDDFSDLELTSQDEGKRSIDTYHIEERIRSYFGRLNYDYAEKYLISGTFRQDGYSRLLGDNRWGFFPGVSAGWIVNKENFMKDYNSLISFLKVRASYGLNGNVSDLNGNPNDIDAYVLQGSYNNTNYNNTVGYVVGNIPNPGLKWERSKTAEVGIDVSFLENKINTNFTYYNRLTLDKYANIPLPISSGISSISSNNGEFRNKGLEVDMSVKALRKEDWTWDVSANITYSKNIVEKLPDNGLENNRQGAFQVYDGTTGNLIWVGGYQEGQQPGDLYAFKALGVFNDWDEVNAEAANRKDITTGWWSNGRPVYGPDAWDALGDDKGNGLPLKPGDMNFLDVNEDGVIDDFDQVKMGNTRPKWFGGITSNLSYKGFTFYARMDYSLGFVQLDVQRPWFMGFGQGTFNTLVETRDTWTPDNPTAEFAEYRWADQLGSRNYFRQSSRWVYKGDYLAFREVSLSYGLPNYLMEDIGMKAVTLSVTGQNLGYLTASKLNRPEIFGSSMQWAGYTSPRTVIFGVNVKF